jgi:hypothetical protein
VADKVSVLICTYNYGRFLPECLNYWQPDKLECVCEIFARQPALGGVSTRAARRPAASPASSRQESLVQ